MRFLLFRFWPVLIPLLLYVLWLQYVGHKAQKKGEPKLRFRDGPWYWAVLASLATGFACLIYIGMTTPAEKGDYTPPRMENGAIVPGHVNR